MRARRAVAELLAPAVLVRAVMSAEAENRRLRKQARKRQERQQRLQARLQELQLAEAARSSRLQTLEEVISALHGNLGDLRRLVLLLDLGGLHRLGDGL